MSEINSIANGTFTIGQTSATNFQAGPGISITQPSEGTVRIAHDETVLYETTTITNNTAGQVFNLSEPATNFEYLRLTCDNMEYNNRPLTFEIEILNSSCTYYTPWINGGTPLEVNIPYASYTINNTGNLVLQTRGLIYGSWSTPYHTNGDNRGYCLMKVIGINRKEV